MLKFNLIIVNYGSENDTIECFQSILKQSYTNFSVFLVDNSPNNCSIDKIKTWANNQLGIKYLYVEEQELLNYELDIKNYEWIFIKAEQNNGFAAANNVALDYISNNIGNNEYCWLLNNDTIISKNALEKISIFIKQNEVDLLGTSLMEYYSPNVIQSIAGGYNPKFSRLEVYKTYNSFVNSKAIRYPNGASMIISKKFLTHVGRLSERYFLYFEELDWVMRGKKQGFNPKFMIDKIVFHKGGGTTGKNSKLADYYYLRSRFIITKIFFHSKLFKTLLFSIIMYPINRLRRGQVDRIIILFQVIRDVFFRNEYDSLKKK